MKSKLSAGNSIVFKSAGGVADRRREGDLLGQRLRPLNRFSTDIDAGEGSKRVVPLLEDAIEVARAAAQRERVAGVTAGKEPIAHPIDPVRIAIAGNQKIVIEVHLRDAGPRQAFEVVDEIL